MGRKPCCAKEGVNRGAWTPKEDRTLTTYINIHGEGKWRSLPQNAGLNRCGKSCRLRWLNYLKPDIKRGNISVEEEDLIIRLHNLLGNRWSLIARRLPGRTDNEIKNYWNTTLSKKNHLPKNEIFNGKQKRLEETQNVTKQDQKIQSKALKCTKIASLDKETSVKDHPLFKCDDESPSSSSPTNNTSSDVFMDFDINDMLFSDFSDILEFEEDKRIRGYGNGIHGDFNGILNKSFDFDFSISGMESLLNSTSTSDGSIFIDDSEAMASCLDQLNEDSMLGFNTDISFFTLEDEW